jgi:SAM-dependent methyltransferase
MAQSIDILDIQQGSADRFGYSWSRFHELTEQQEEQFRRWTCHLDPETDWRGKRFLDVGCGAGRNSFWAMKYGAASGKAIDVDEQSLAAAGKTLATFPTVEIQFQSAYEIDEVNEFDIAFSIGVIHHLEHPKRALEKMAKATKPGGKVLIWVYGRENMELYVRVLNPLRKLLFSRLPVWCVRLIAYAPAAALWLLLRLGLLKLEYFRLLATFSFRHLHHIVFDQMLPKIANYWRRDEVEQLLAAQGLTGIRLEWVNEMSWSAIGTKRFP